MVNTTNWFKSKLGTLKEDFDFRLEKLILDVTEKISERMIQKKYSRVKLAQKLGISAPAVTKIFDGNSNFTLRRLLSLADALDVDLTVDFKPKWVAEEDSFISSLDNVCLSASANQFSDSEGYQISSATESFTNLSGARNDSDDLDQAA